MKRPASPDVAAIEWRDMPTLDGRVRIVAVLRIDGVAVAMVPLSHVVNGDHGSDWGYPDDASDAPTYRSRQQRP